jgi:tetratricopeptide (TPR) repeat protein
VISDSVNLASRIQGMTRMYDTPLLISDSTFHQLKDPGQFATRIVDRVIAKGRSGAVTLREVFDADPAAIRDAKYATAELIGRAFSLYYSRQLEEAAELFQQSLAIYPEDKVAAIYIKRCQHYIKEGLEDDWDGITTLEHK